MAHFEFECIDNIFQVGPTQSWELISSSGIGAYIFKYFDLKTNLKTYSINRFNKMIVDLLWCPMQEYDLNAFHIFDFNMYNVNNNI